MGRLQAAPYDTAEVRALLHASVEKLDFKRRAAAVAPAETLTFRSLQRALAIQPNDLNALV